MKKKKKKKCFQQNDTISSPIPLVTGETSIHPYQPFLLLIDADNTPADAIPQIIEHAQNWGTITSRRIYGNQEVLLGQKWKELCLKYALQPVLHLGISGAKNATDITLTIDAMDLLWLYKETRPDFCLVTGDQDFTSLVLRLRNQGCRVYCIGKTTRAEAFAKVCTAFYSTERLSPSIAASQPTKAPSTKTQNMVPALLHLLTQAIQQVSKEKHLEWISIQVVGMKLKQLDPQFQTKTYGYKNLPTLIRSHEDVFEHRAQGAHLEIRLKTQKKKGKKE